MSIKDLDLNDPDLMAPCGTNCGVCPYLIAYKTNDQHLKEKLAKSIGIKPEQIICEGCMSEEPLFFCKMCGMKKCVLEKEGIDSCADCDEYPCKIIEKFPYKMFLNRQAWDVNYRKAHNKEDWIKITKEMNSCTSCGALGHWRATVCKECGSEIKERYI